LNLVNASSAGNLTATFSLSEGAWVASPTSPCYGILQSAGIDKVLFSSTIACLGKVEVRAHERSPYCMRPQAQLLPIRRWAGKKHLTHCALRYYALIPIACHAPSQVLINGAKSSAGGAVSATGYAGAAYIKVPFRTHLQYSAAPTTTVSVLGSQS
jgi:hypothetical protein